MNTKQIIEKAGSAAALARLLEITQGAVAQWGEFPPEHRIWQLKVLRPKWFKEQPVAKKEAP